MRICFHQRPDNQTARQGQMPIGAIDQLDPCSPRKTNRTERAYACMRLVVCDQRGLPARAVTRLFRSLLVSHSALRDGLRAECQTEFPSTSTTAMDKAP